MCGIQHMRFVACTASAACTNQSRRTQEERGVLYGGTTDRDDTDTRRAAPRLDQTMGLGRQPIRDATADGRRDGSDVRGLRRRPSVDRPLRHQRHRDERAVRVSCTASDPITEDVALPPAVSGSRASAQSADSLHHGPPLSASMTTLVSARTCAVAVERAKGHGEHQARKERQL